MTDRTIETPSPDLLAHVEGPVGVMTFNRPERRNALSEGVYDGFEAALPEMVADPAVRVILVTGAGGAFCAGGDVKGFSERNQSGERPSVEAAVEDLRRRQRLVSLALHQAPKPVVAALPGAAAGAGLSIALAADLRIAAERAVIVPAFGTIGASGDFGGSWFLTHLVGTARARELYFTSPRLTAAEAAEMGIVNRVLPDEGFEEAAMGYARDLADRAPVALRLMKENLNRALTCDLATALDAEAPAMVRSMSTADHVEAVAAFMEKRPASFTGR